MLTTLAIARISTSSRLPWGVVAGAIIGGGFLVWLTGTRPLDPTNIEWVMTGDWVPHYFGWAYFRAEPWHWPPGTIRGYYAPLGTSIGLTDSIPLAAYMLKPLSAWLPQPFQYLGLWLLLCYVLQGALAARLLSRWSPSVVVQMLGATLFVLLPTLLVRVGHAALCAHWLILWALLLASRVPSHPPGRWFPVAQWAALGLVSGMTQPYLAAMVLAILLAASFGGGGVPAIVRGVAMGSAMAATLTGFWLSGLFVLQGAASLTSGGLGYYSMNLLAPISPFGWSAVLPELPIAGTGQAYEGFQYLGLGNLLMIAAAALLAWRARRARAEAITARLWTPAMVGICLLMTAFAVSPTITLGSLVLVDLNGPWSAPLAAFRSSGRFFWPLAYLGLAWAVASVTTRLSRPAAIAAMSVAVAVQAADLHAVHEDRRRTARSDAFYTWTDPFASSRWATIAPGYAHLALVPPPQCGTAPQPYEAAVRLASQHGLTLNAGVIARGDVGAQRRYCADLDARIGAGTLASDTLYVVSEAGATAVTKAGGDRAACGRVEAVWVCTVPEAHARWRDPAPFDRVPGR